MFKRNPPLTREQIFRARTVPESVPLERVLCGTAALEAIIKQHIPPELERYLKSERLQGHVEGDTVVISKA